MMVPIRCLWQPCCTTALHGNRCSFAKPALQHQLAVPGQRCIALHQLGPSGCDAALVQPQAMLHLMLAAGDVILLPGGQLHSQDRLTSAATR